MNKYKRLLSNTLIFGLGTFSSKVMVYLLMPLYTALLSKAEYSTADLITQTANLLMPLAAIGMYDGLFRFALDAGEKKNEVFSSSITMLLVGSGVFLALSPVLWFFDLFDGYNWLIVVFVITANFQYACANYVRGLGHAKLYAVQGIVNTACTILFNIIFLVGFDMGVLGYVLSVVVANVIVTVFLVLMMKLWRDFSFAAVTTQCIKDLLKYSIPMIPTTVFWWMTSVSNRFMVAHFCGDDVNGLFAAAYKIPTVITLLTTIFIEAWHLSAVRDADEKERSAFYSSVFKSYMGIIFMAAAGLIAFSKLFTMLLLNVSYYDAWQFMPTLIVATVFSALTTFMGSVYIVKKKSVMSFITAMTGAVLNVTLTFVLVPIFIEYFGVIVGAQGAALAAMISYISVFTIRTVNAQSYVKFNTQTIKLIINTILVALQALTMILELKSWIFMQIGFVAIIIVINGKPILDGALMLLRELKRKTSHNAE